MSLYCYPLASLDLEVLVIDICQLYTEERHRDKLLMEPRIGRYEKTCISGLEMVSLPTLLINW
jgi:hypothetical protein